MDSTNKNKSSKSNCLVHSLKHQRSGLAKRNFCIEVNIIYHRLDNQTMPVDSFDNQINDITDNAPLSSDNLDDVSSNDEIPAVSLDDQQ